MKSVVRLVLNFSTGYSKPRSLCEEHKVQGGLKEILLNLLLGWWGIHAFFWNLWALVENLRGGREVTAELERLYVERVLEAKKMVEKNG